MDLEWTTLVRVLPVSLSLFLSSQQCLGPDVPSTHVFSLPENRCLVTLDTNSHIHRQLAVSSMPRLMEFSLPLSSSPASVARVKLTLPPVLREEEDFSFPLLVNM